MRNRLTVKKIEHLKDKVIIEIGNDEHDYHLVIDKQCFADNKVEAGAQVDEDFVDRVKICDQFHQIMEGAFKYLKKRDYGAAELTSKLIRKYANAQAVSMVVDELKRRNYLNDDKFLIEYINKRQNKGIGIPRIIEELGELGFANITEFVYKIGQQKEIENALKQGELYLKKNLKKVDDKLKAGLYMKLTYLGYDNQTIKKVFNHLNLALDDYN